MKKTFKNFSLILLTASSFALQSKAQGTTFSRNLSTGYVESTGSFINYGSPDNWTVLTPGSSTYVSAYVCSDLNGAWASQAYARWITPYLSGTQPLSPAPVGVYSYARSIQIDYTSLHSARLDFPYVGGDDNVTGVQINGHQYSLAPSTATDYNPLAVNKGFAINPTDLHPGLNTILVTVYNDGYNTGFFANVVLTFNVN